MKPKTEVRTNAVSAGVRLSLSRAGLQFAQVVAGAFSGRTEALAAGVPREDQDTVRLTPGSAAYDRMRALLRADREHLATLHSAQPTERNSPVPDEFGSVSESGRLSAVPAQQQENLADNSEVSALTTSELEPVDMSPVSGEMPAVPTLAPVPVPLAPVPSGAGSGVSTLPQPPRPAPGSMPSEPVDSGSGGNVVARAVLAPHPVGSATVMAGFSPSVVARASAAAATGFSPSVVGRATAAQSAVTAGVSQAAQMANRASVAQVKSVLPPPVPPAVKRRSAAEELAARAPVAPAKPAKTKPDNEQASAAAGGDESGGPDPIRTLTMARLLAMQGYRKRALSIYDELLARDPDDAKLRAEADRLRSP